MQFNRITHHDINIRHSANGGCIVKVGCGEFAFSNPDEMLEALRQYYNNPEKMEKEYTTVAQGPVEVATAPDAVADEPYEHEHGTQRERRPNPRLASREAMPINSYTEEDENF